VAIIWMLLIPVFFIENAVLKYFGGFVEGPLHTALVQFGFAILTLGLLALYGSKK
jgi:hypothetical protein